MAQCNHCDTYHSWDHVCNAYCRNGVHADLAYCRVPLPEHERVEALQREIDNTAACEHVRDSVVSVREAPEAPDDNNEPWLTEKYVYFFTNRSLSEGN